jgi:hypothetical protein
MITSTRGPASGGVPNANERRAARRASPVGITDAPLATSRQRCQENTMGLSDGSQEEKLLAAAGDGDWAAVRTLVNSGANISCRDEVRPHGGGPDSYTRAHGNPAGKMAREGSLERRLRGELRCCAALSPRAPLRPAWRSGQQWYIWGLQRAARCAALRQSRCRRKTPLASRRCTTLHATVMRLSCRCCLSAERTRKRKPKCVAACATGCRACLAHTAHGARVRAVQCAGKRQRCLCPLVSRRSPPFQPWKLLTRLPCAAPWLLFGTHSGISRP